MYRIKLSHTEIGDTVLVRTILLTLPEGEEDDGLDREEF